MYEYLPPQLQSFKNPRKGKKVYSFSDILDKTKCFTSNQRSMLSEIVHICKLLFSYCSYRRKTIFNCKKKQEVSASKDVHKTRKDSLQLNVANKFVNRNDNH